MHIPIVTSQRPMRHANIASFFVQFVTLVMVLTVSTPLVRVTSLFKFENSPGDAAVVDQKPSKRQVTLTGVMVLVDGRLIDRLTPRYTLQRAKQTMGRHRKQDLKTGFRRWSGDRHWRTDGSQWPGFTPSRGWRWCRYRGQALDIRSWTAG